MEEVNAFKEGAFIKMHNSKLCKVGFLQSVIDKMTKGNINTKSTGMGAYIDRVFESRASKIIGLTGTALGIFMAVIEIRQLLTM